MNNSIAFHKVAIVIGTRDEVISLRETVLGIEKSCSPEDIARVILLLAPDVITNCREEAYKLAKEGFPISVEVVQEEGGNLATEVPNILRKQADISHAAFWPADLDAPPETLALMMEKAKENPAAVVTLSRLIPGGSLITSKGLFINLRDTVFARLVCMLYRSKQTDPHFVMSIFPVRDFLRFDLREKFMAFLLEYTLCFERLGTEVIEIPLKQQPRTEGKSNLSVFDKLHWLVPVFRLRFLPKRKIFREGTDEQT